MIGSKDGGQETIRVFSSSRIILRTFPLHWPEDTQLQIMNATGMHIEASRVGDAESSLWWVILPLLVAAGLRFYNLPENSIWFDEAVSIRHARLPFWEMMEWVPYDDNPPLHHIILFVELAFVWCHRIRRSSTIGSF